MTDLTISRVEVHPVMELGASAFICKEHEADFFGLFGFVEGEVNSFYLALGDFPNKAAAELARDLLNNKKSKGVPPQ